jgi:hypothetical protein
MLQVLFKNAPQFYKKREGSGSGSRRTKNMRILWIRIRIPNTGCMGSRFHPNHFKTTFDHPSVMESPLCLPPLGSSFCTVICPSPETYPILHIILILWTKYIQDSLPVMSYLALKPVVCLCNSQYLEDCFP